MAFSVDIGSLRPVVYDIPVVSTRLSFSDYLGAIKVRWGIGRNHYTVMPGLYKVGEPGRESDVLVSANYKLSFDTLRKNLGSINAWILVLDTKGVNVWCAAGKGTFGTDNLINSIKKAGLENMVQHRRIIVPQLGAVGVAAHKVKEQTGFRVIFGPVQARDIREFVNTGYKATREMRKITFPIHERAKLIPVDLMYGKYKLLLVLFVLFVVSGLDSSGFLFKKMIETSSYPLFNVLGAYLAGIVIAPLLLPIFPLRPFALKGTFWGLVVFVFINMFFEVYLIERIATGFICLAVASFVTMNFTGSSTYTSLSGVKKEMKLAIPFQVVFASVGLVLFIISKLLR